MPKSKRPKIELRPYKKQFSYSYSFGAYPTIELLTHQPNQVIKVLLHHKLRDDEGAQKVRQLCEDHNIRTEDAGRALEKISGAENVYIAGVFRKYETKIDDDQSHVVLVGPRDMGNIGTIMRTMQGFGLNDLAIIRPAAEVLAPKSVRAGMGAVFQMNVEYFDSFEKYQSRFPSHNPYPFLLDGVTELASLEPQDPYSLVFGNEGAGLDESFSKIGESVYISHEESIDSLNLAMAVGISLYQVSLKEKE